MRRPNRHIEIVSMSALDLFASALGSFIMVAVILFPYYLKDQRAAEDLTKAEARIADMSAQLAALQNRAAEAQAAAASCRAASDRSSSQLTQTQQNLQLCEAQLAKPLLVVGIKWTTPGADVDLHVTDPEGHEFYYFKNNENRRDFPNSPAELSYDMTTGPAVELWQTPAASPGEYKVDYVANALPEGYQVEVKGTVFDREGRKELPVKVLRRPKERVHAATIVVAANGSVTIR